MDVKPSQTLPAGRQALRKRGFAKHKASLLKNKRQNLFFHARRKKNIN